MLLHVELNGTDENPYHVMGLTQNPFPQIASAEYAGQCLRLQSLGGTPIDSNDPEGHIRRVLAGWSEEFVDLCCKNYRAGKIVKFTVTFFEGREGEEDTSGNYPD